MPFRQISTMNAGWWRSMPIPRRRKLAYLGLHAFCNIADRSRRVSSPRTVWPCTFTRRWGWWPISLPKKFWPKLHGTLAIGHTRYSTAGDSSLLNAQPIMVQSNKGMMALAHNGNLVNAQEIRGRLEGQGLDFPDQQRYRGDRSSDRALERAHFARGDDRCLAAGGRRVFAGDDQP